MSINNIRRAVPASPCRRVAVSARPRACLEQSRKVAAFTLIEVVIALGILTIGVLAFAKIFPAGRIVVEHAGQRTRAVAMAEKLLREFQKNPSLLAYAYQTSVSLSPNCFDSSAKPHDSQDLGALPNPPCGTPPNGVDEVVRVVGEGGAVDESFPGIWHLRFPPYVVFPSPDPDIRSPRIYADVSLGGFAFDPSGASTAGFQFYYNPGPGPGMITPPAFAPQVTNIAAGEVVIPSPNPASIPSYPGPLSAPVANYAVSQRVFRCSYQWADNTPPPGNVHHVVDERNKVAVAAAPQRFRLQAVNSGIFSRIVADPSNATGTLTIVEEVDLSWRIAAPAPAIGFEPIGFVAGGAAAPLAPLVPYAVIPMGTKIKFDYSIAPDPTDQKRWRWITEPAEVPSSGVLKLSLRPLDRDKTINILRAGGGIPIGVAAGVSRTAADTNGACTAIGCSGVELPCAVAGTLPPEVCAIDYEKGEIHFNTSVISVKTPLWVTYRPTEDWVVQVLSAPQVYVPWYANRPNQISQAPQINFGDPGTGYQRYREYRESLVPNIVGFHKSEIGKTVIVDYVDAADKPKTDKLMIVDPSPLPYVFTTDFPGEIFLSSNYSRIVKVNGWSVKVRILWADKNNYREVFVTGAVGVR